jgi:hypothetical protein
VVGGTFPNCFLLIIHFDFEQGGSTMPRRRKPYGKKMRRRGSGVGR